MQPRLAPVTEPYPADAAGDLLAIMPPGVPPLALFRVLAHNPRVLGRIRGGGLLDRGSIPLRQREIVILRTTARLGSDYEWGVHVQIFAAKARFSAAEIEATAAREAGSLWSPDEWLLLRLVDALVDRHDISDALWAEASSVWSPAQLIEIVVLVGFYHSIAFVTAAFRVPLEPGAPRLPRQPG